MQINDDKWPKMPRRYSTKMARLFVVVACMVLILSIGHTDFKHKASSADDMTSFGEAPSHFYLNDNCYLYHGGLVYSLPDGFELVGEVKNVGDAFSGIDFEGNIEGYIYMNPSLDGIAYFKDKKWDETVDGQQPYLEMDIDE